MKTYQFIILTAALLLLGGLQYVQFQNNNVPTQTLGTAVSAPLYYLTTNSSVSCPSATSTQLLAGGTGRNYFAAVNDSANNIYVCKGASCTANTGVRLNGSGGSYEQLISQDGYTGAYSCIASTATSTLVVTYAQ